jgi:centrosomal protein CEP44
MHHILLVYSPHVAYYITEKGYALKAQNDFKFMESTYKLLLNVFGYKPQLTLQQFFQNGFAERKIIFSTDVIGLLK